MESLLGPLLPLFERERAAGRAVALGLLVETAGSTYRKPGALMLIAANGDSAGLLSGGCLEGDLAEYARSVIETGTARLVTYDMRGGDDLVWGLGLGCEGAMHILLIRVGPDNDWQPLEHFSSVARRSPARLPLVSSLNRSARTRPWALLFCAGDERLDWSGSRCSGRSPGVPVGLKPPHRVGRCLPCRCRCRPSCCCWVPDRMPRPLLISPRA